MSEHDDVIERSAIDSGGAKMKSGDAERAICKVHDQSEKEDVGVVCVEEEADARDGPLSPGTDDVGSQGRGGNHGLLSTIEKPTSAGPAMNGTREMCDSSGDDTRGTGDGQARLVADATARESREPNYSIALPSAEGGGQGATGGIADDGVGGPETETETTALAALTVVDNPRRRAEVQLSRNVAGGEGDEGGEGEADSVMEASLRSKLNDSSRNGHAQAGPEEVHSIETSPASSADSAATSAVSTGAVATGADCEQDSGGEVGDEVASAVRTGSDEAMGADDFLPLFSLVLVSGVEMLVGFLRGRCAFKIGPTACFL